VPTEFVPKQRHQLFCSLRCRHAAFHGREVLAKAQELARELYGSGSDSTGLDAGDPIT
jgi:hypothetical protein